MSLKKRRKVDESTMIQNCFVSAWTIRVSWPKNIGNIVGKNSKIAGSKLNFYLTIGQRKSMEILWQIRGEAFERNNYIKHCNDKTITDLYKTHMWNRLINKQ
jgi:hypothetical protein